MRYHHSTGMVPRMVPNCTDSELFFRCPTVCIRSVFFPFYSYQKSASTGVSPYDMLIPTTFSYGVKSGYNHITPL